jgi:transcriptional regulator with XRE-family HTH domain
MNNKNVFAKNLKKYLDLSEKSRKEVCDALGFNYYTFTSWINGTKYPRMDKVEMLAQYFGILKSDLIEEKTDDSVRDVQITERELRIIRAVRRMSEEEKQAFETLLGTKQQ